MSFFEKGAVRIHYEEAGSGFPLLRGDGWGEGLSPRTRLAESPPHPDFRFA